MTTMVALPKKRATSYSLFPDDGLYWPLQMLI